MLNLFIPEIISSALIVAFFGFTLAKKERSYKFYGNVALGGAAILTIVCACALRKNGLLFSGTYNTDLFSQGIKLALAAALLINILFSKLGIYLPKGKAPEYFAFLFSATLGMMMLASAVDILTLYLSLELSSYSLYILAALRGERKTAEAGVKYLLFGAAASGILLWGLSLIAGISGTTSLAAIASNIAVLSGEPAFILGLIFTSLAFLFKLSGFPSHFWAPDVYESASTPVTAFIATSSKLAAVALLIRFFYFVGVSPNMMALLGTLAFMSMTLGNTVALVQKDVKRLLAYSSIAQAGYILVGLLSGSADGLSSTFFYGIAYFIMNAGAFLVLLLVAKDTGNDNPQIEHFNGLADRAPFFSLLLLLSLLSLAGIPPLVGFTGKWILFSAAMDRGLWLTTTLVVWGVINSVISLFYYLTLVKHAYLEKSSKNSPMIIPMSYKLTGLVLFCAVVLLGVYPTPVIEFAREAIRAIAA